MAYCKLNRWNLRFSLRNDKENHLSYEKKPGCLGYRGDEILPIFLVIIINHDKDPYLCC